MGRGVQCGLRFRVHAVDIIINACDRPVSNVPKTRCFIRRVSNKYMHNDPVEDKADASVAFAGPQVRRS